MEENLSARVEEMGHKIADLKKQVQYCLKLFFSIYYHFDRIFNRKVKFGTFVFRLMQPWEQKTWSILSVYFKRSRLYKTIDKGDRLTIKLFQNQL